MIVATQGLVLHTTDYSESSIIAKIFTRQLGVRSYILKGVRSSKSRTKQNLLQPLSYVDLSVYDSPKTNLNYVKDIHPARQFASTTTDAARITVVFFMNEVLYKALREGAPMPEIFDYLVEELTALDEGRRKLSTQPLLFLVHLASLMGIEPMNNYGLHETLFNLYEGRFMAPPTRLDNLTNAPYLLNADDSLELHYLLASCHESSPMPVIDGHKVLHTLLDYYGLHIPECKDFKSVDILHTLL